MKYIIEQIKKRHNRCWVKAAIYPLRIVRDCCRKCVNSVIMHLPVNQLLRFQPKIFYIETVLGCNLKCPECAVGAGLLNRKTGVMSFEKYKILADKIRPYAKEVVLVIWGEPLLNKDIYKIIEYTAEFAETVAISTNGNLMTEASAEMLIKSGVTNIIVSIDGATQEVYEQYRVGGSFEKTFAALSYLQAAKQKFCTTTVIIPQFIVFKHNQHQIEDFKKLCLDIGLKADFKSPYLRDDSSFSNSGFPQYIRQTCADEVARGEAMRNCTAIRNVMTVLLDGTVVPCCTTSNGEFSLGNLFEQDVIEIWQGEKWGNFRRAVFIGKAPGYCRKNCLAYFVKKEK